jgi:hypothetical protein
MFPTVTSSYTWFFNLGIFLFVSHLLLYGVGLDLSYFGLLLIYLGWVKPVLHTWFRWILWIFILLDVYSTIKQLYNRYSKDILK